MISITLVYKVIAYNFSTECDILSPDEIDATRYVSILFPNVDALNGILQQ